MNNLKICDLFANCGVLNDFPFPINDFDSLTQYEMLIKCINHIKKLWENDSTLTNRINALAEYINNLDLQDEVNNKINEMVESGELQEIITSYLQINGVLAFNTVADMVNATNIIDGSICKTLGENTYKDGKGQYYKIRTITSGDIVDNVNIIALNISDTLIAEKIPNYFINEIVENEKVINKFKEYYYGELSYSTTSYSSFQSGTTIDNKLVLGLPNNDENEDGIILVYDLENQEIINNITLSSGHLDNMTNDGNNVYINDMTNKTIYIINKEDLTSLTPTIESITYTDLIGAIVYNTDDNKMYSVLGNRLNKLDSDFNVESYIEIESNSNIAQGVIYYDHKYIISKINNNPTILNNIVIINEDGKVLVDSIINNVINGESEFISVIDNKLYDFRTRKTSSNLLLEIYRIDYNNEFTDSLKFNEEYINTYYSNSIGNINIYCDNTKTQLEVLGTSDKPFHSLITCLEFISNIKIKGNINLFVDGTYLEDYISYSNIYNNLTIDKISSGCTINTLVLNNGIYTIKGINISQLNINNCECIINGANISKPSGSAIISNFSKLKIDSGSIHDSYYGINATLSNIVVTVNPSTIFTNNTNGINANNNTVVSLYQGAYVNYLSDYLSEFKGIIYLEDYANLNNYNKINGNYSSDQYGAWHVTNLPTNFTTSHKFNLKVEKVGINNTKQTLTDYTDGKIYSRVYDITNQTWTTWQ